MSGLGSLFALSLLVRLFMGKDGIGWGDIKLMGGFGAYFGPKGVFVIYFLACLVGGVLMLIGLALGKVRRQQYVPFGPFLNFAMVSYLWLIFLGVDIFDWISPVRF